MAEADRQEFDLQTVNSRACDKLRRDMGPIMGAALAHPKTVEVFLNPDGQLWQESLGEGMRVIGKLEPARAEAIIKTVAGFHRQEATRFNPIVEGEFPLDGSRFAGQLPPIVANPAFAIRKRAVAVFTLDEYVEKGIMSPKHAALIRNAVASHKNILVIGGTGSGKTTLLNAAIHEMVVINPFERITIVEDTGELQCAAVNCVLYHTSPTVDMTRLLRVILRMRPDRILVGEVRGPEALDLLDAWNTGHEGGAGSLHANNPDAALLRLRSLVTRNPAAPKEIEALIGECVHMIVHIARDGHSRRVLEVMEVHGYANGQYQTTRH